MAKLKLLSLGLLLLGGCGQVYSPVGATTSTAAAASSGILLTNFEGGGLFSFLNPPLGERNPINSTINIKFNETQSATQYYWDLSGTAAPSVPGGSTLVDGSPARGLRIHGIIGKDGPPYWPYAQVVFPLSTVGVDLIAMAPTGKLTFSMKALTGTAYANQYRIVLTDQTITDFGWYGYTINVSNSNWQTVTVNFPPTAAPNKFAQPTWPTQIPFTTTARNVTNIVFAVLANGMAQKNYDVVLDDFWLR